MIKRNIDEGKRLLKLNLQHFAEGEGEGDGGGQDDKAAVLPLPHE